MAGASGALTPGATAGFDPLVSRSYRVATITNGLPNTPALATLFTIDASDFIARNKVNPSSSFSLSFGGNVSGSAGSGGTISIVYTATPEPTTTLLFGLSAAVTFSMRRRDAQGGTDHPRDVFRTGFDSDTPINPSRPAGDSRPIPTPIDLAAECRRPSNLPGA